MFVVCEGILLMYDVGVAENSTLMEVVSPGTDFGITRATNGL